MVVYDLLLIQYGNPQILAKILSPLNCGIWREFKTVTVQKFRIIIIFKTSVIFFSCKNTSIRNHTLKINIFGDIHICFPSGTVVKNLPANAGDTRDTSPIPGWDDLLEKEMAAHSSILTWKIPWTGEPDRLQSMGS